MKIGIVTVYKSHNCGSFLQAYALRKKISDMGYEAFFVPYCMFSNTIFDVFFKCVKAFLKGRFNLILFLIKRFLVFKKNSCKYLKTSFFKKSLDMFVFGSDTLWNFEDSFFYKRKKFFLGSWTKKKKVAFSISVASSDPSKFILDSGVIDALKKFHKITVRDNHSFNFVKILSDRNDLLETIDPTMLLAPNEYLPIKCENTDERYLFIYYFGTYSKDLIHEIISFAKRQKICIVNMGYPIKFADKNVVNDPFKFVQYIKNADYVLTDTFHGCAFSILFNKLFVTNGFAKKKVEYLLNKFSLENRFFYNDNDFSKKIENHIDYKPINSEIEVCRQKSFEILKSIFV